MRKVLIANRGEIAVRIMRTCKDMGIKTVAVYSEADRNATHVKLADEAVCIGPPPSNQSYLLENEIIKAAKLTKADGIHPGYGFLSENASFANKVKRYKIKFIGPNSRAIEIMGNKLAAKDTVAKFGVPMVPGTDKAISNIKAAKKVAAEIKLPILIKAAAGGGGKGMRIVNKMEDFEEQMKRAVSEAKSAFGDGSVFIEKYIKSSRHIEIQILADAHGNVVHLFERECSIQRRHQKVIEEAPSSILTPELREKMGHCAINVAKSCKYVGAGTVEFLLDNKMNFYFLEMNTRLQVEHPVTEQITGVDLVKEQINIADGKKISFKQEDLLINGHAIELRVYAEDPSENFLPATGSLNIYQPPKGLGVRVDDGYEEGMDIPVYYDPLMAKLITYGKDRKEAINRMKRAISEYKISGVANTLLFGDFVMNNKDFIKGTFDTHFVEKHFKPKFLNKEDKNKAMIAVYIAGLLSNEHIAKGTKFQLDKQENWKKSRVIY
ncbi:MAG: acetyl-CoA carboxylase biotin carboxylase subunit [Bacteroidetes bacterium]|nr:MAG: acetyl-CoA carboxylase biotin carboxylase subunit [Bacteroidota bacterium]